jgi:integral membrane protein
MDKTFSLFRKVAYLEGWSFILLLGLAMPLKYLFNIPQAVKYIGWAHGVLFVAYVALLVVCMESRKWKISFAILCFLASLVPFGTFWLENKKLKNA